MLMLLRRITTRATTELINYNNSYKNNNNGQNNLNSEKRFIQDECTETLAEITALRAGNLGARGAFANSGLGFKFRVLGFRALRFRV